MNVVPRSVWAACRGGLFWAACMGWHDWGNLPGAAWLGPPFHVISGVAQGRAGRRAGCRVWHRAGHSSWQCMTGQIAWQGAGRAQDSAGQGRAWRRAWCSLNIPICVLNMGTCLLYLYKYLSNNVYIYIYACVLACVGSLPGAILAFMCM